MSTRTLGVLRTLLAVCLLFAMSAWAQDPATPPASTTTQQPDAPKPSLATGMLPNAASASKPMEGGAFNNFHNFLHELGSPLTPLAPAVSAGIGMYTQKDSEFGHGAEGFGNRYAVAFADQFNGLFVRKFAMPTIFNQVETYHPLGRGHSADMRIAHAFAHSFVTKTRHGHNTINMSGIPASAVVAAAGMGYYPDYYTSAWRTASRAGYQQAGYFGGDLWSEFKPDLCRVVHLKCGKEN